MDDNSRKVHHSDLVLDVIREDPVGRDDRQLDREYVAFRNEGTTELDLSDWSVENERGDSFRFPAGTVVSPDERVVVRSGRGTNTASEFYWGSDRPVWRNAGDTVVVRDADGEIRIRESYNE